MKAKIFLAAALCAIPLGAFAQSPSTSAAREIARLDHRGVDFGDRPAVPVGVHSLVSKPSDDVLEKRTDVGVRLDDQDPCHTKIIRQRRWDPAPVQV